jgi:hypothetical protein
MSKFILIAMAVFSLASLRAQLFGRESQRPDDGRGASRLAGAKALFGT